MTIRNRIADSGLVVLALEDFFPPTHALCTFDIVEGLEKGMLLREKPFRTWLNDQDFTPYADKYVAITCSSQAIVPPWAYMLACVQLQQHAALCCVGNIDVLRQAAFVQAMARTDWQQLYTAKRVMIKGCSKDLLAPWAYAQLSLQLMPHVLGLMYGEPCSTVPVYKK